MVCLNICAIGLCTWLGTAATWASTPNSAPNASSFPEPMCAHPKFASSACQRCAPKLLPNQMQPLHACFAFLQMLEGCATNNLYRLFVLPLGQIWQAPKKAQWKTYGTREYLGKEDAPLWIRLKGKAKATCPFPRLPSVGQTLVAT